MRYINRPPLAAGEIFDACKLLCRDVDLRSRLAGVKETVETEVTRYEDYASRSRLCEIHPADGTPPHVTGEEMRGLYLKMRDRDEPRRLYYDVLLAGAPNRTCPYCGHRKVSTLDHFLPKSYFPVFSITPSNLVPSCKDCNHGKRSNTTTDPSEQYLHPYFDQLPDEIWLTAKVVEGAPAAFKFDAKPPASDVWTEELRLRIENQFHELELADLYTSHAASRLCEIRGVLQKNLSKSRDQVWIWLDDSRESAERNHLNSWEAAFYRACVASDWFCEGGFNADGEQT